MKHTTVSLSGCASHFWGGGEEGEAQLVESGANALTAFKCCVKIIAGLNFLIGGTVALRDAQKMGRPDCSTRKNSRRAWTERMGRATAGPSGLFELFETLFDGRRRVDPSWLSI